jgi:hypothetical protein
VLFAVDGCLSVVRAILRMRVLATHHEVSPATAAADVGSVCRLARRTARHARQRVGVPVDPRLARNSCSRAVRENICSHSRQIRDCSVIVGSPLRRKDRPRWKDVIRTRLVPSTQ